MLLIFIAFGFSTAGDIVAIKFLNNKPFEVLKDIPQNPAAKRYVPDLIITLNKIDNKQLKLAIDEALAKIDFHDDRNDHTEPLFFGRPIFSYLVFSKTLPGKKSGKNGF